MKNDFLNLMPKRILFSTVMASALLAVSPQIAWAEVNEMQTVMQNGSVRGRVLDANGEPIIGASVLEKGTTNGTITDMDGNFSLSVSSKAVLSVTYIGYKPVEIPVDGKSALNITMKEDTETLDEVVVVAYGTQKKATMTGAVTSVDTKVLSGKTMSTPVAALQGQIAGMTITRSSSAPGREGWSYKIRGQASINDPGVLVIVDGIPGSINDLNPDDIESMSVLKDGAAAIYGSRAAGGVVLVTTKRGKNQKTRVTYKGNIAVKTPSMQQSFMDMSQWASAIEEATLNTDVRQDENGNWVTGKAGTAIGAVNYWAIQAMKTRDPRFYNKVMAYDHSAIHDIGFLDYDLNDETWGNAISHSHSLSINGGNEKSRYNISFGYMRDGSPLRSQWGEDKYTKYNVRVNHDLSIFSWFDLATNLSFDRTEKVNPTNSPSEPSGNPPGSPLYTKGGKPFGWASNMTPLMRAKEGGRNNENVNNFSVNVQPTFHIIKGLDLIGNIYFNPWDTNNMKYQNKVTWYDYHDVPYNYNNPGSNFVNREAKTVMKQQYQGYLNYTKMFGESHNLSVMAGTSYEKEKATKFILEKADLTVEELHSVNTGSKYNKGEDEISSWALASYFGRINYDYKGKYLLELLGRYDGSSKFIKGKKWAPFYGVSGGWRISEEKFIKDNLHWLNNLKLRASFGEMGNQSGIDNYDYIALINLNSPSGTSPDNGLFGSDGSPVVGQTITQKNVIAIDRTWEKIKTTNAGFDFAVLNNRLTGTFEYFWKKNNNMLSEVTYPQIFGATAPKTNSGKMEVKGWEITLGWRDQIGQVSYWINGNLSNDENKLITKENAIVKAWDKKTSFLEGYAMNTYWGLEAGKLIENEAELETYRKQLAAKSDVLIDGRLLSVGDMMYKDIDGDGYVTKKDVKCLGDDRPHYSYGINLGAQWKGFDFSATIQGVGKQAIMREKSAGTVYVWNTYQSQGDLWYGKAWSDIAEKLGNNINITYTEPIWGADGSITGSQTVNGTLSLPAINKDPNAVPRSSTNGDVKNYNYAYSNAWYRLQNGAYTRLKNLTIGYTLPKQLLSQIGVANLRVYFSGNDLFEITHTNDGWDPESTTEKPFADANVYPFMRSYSFGIDLTF